MNFLPGFLLCFGLSSVVLASVALAENASCNAPGTCVCQRWVDRSFQVMYWDGNQWVALTDLAPGLANCIRKMKTDPDIKFICEK